MYVCMYVTGLCVLEWFRSHAFFLKDQKECQNQNDTLIPCLICSLYGIVLPVLFAVWHLIKNGRGLLLCHMLSWSSAWTEDQTQGAGKYSGRFTDFGFVLCRATNNCRGERPYSSDICISKGEHRNLIKRSRKGFEKTNFAGTKTILKVKMEISPSMGK